MRKSVKIVEVGPRDGLQSEPEVLSTAVKVAFIDRLAGSGLQRIEVASFVNPRKVPQMADAEQVLAALPLRPGVDYIGLVLNRKGFDRAKAAGCLEIGMALGVTDTFNQRNQGATTTESIAQWLDIAAAARSAGIRAQITLSVAFGCPFEGEVSVERVVDVARRVAQGHPTEIALADTIGVAVPPQVTRAVGELGSALPGVALRCHFHNTRNTGLANALAAVQSGVSTLDASCGGIGGCPFAPAATGNIPTEDLIYLLERSGYETGVSLEQLIETSLWLQGELGRPVPSMLSKAGPFPHRA
ncbi:MAG TPA: hydroxymethylglutaryl-CoA lyase [Steroidobacteraceae bacterium]|nr:hydroxymethylglutaryl-CoA lyase [Steroidobacteraceae bacterium]